MTMPLNTTDIPRADLDIKSQVRSNPLPWKGQFSPQLVEVLLTTYASPQDRVVDPFVGSGTVLGECARLQLPAVGVEINPAAVLLAQLYDWANIEVPVRARTLARSTSVLERLVAKETDSSVDVRNVPIIRPQALALTAQSSPPAIRRILEATLVLADPTWSELAVGRVMSAHKRVRDFILGLPYSAAPICTHHGDARAVPIEDSKADLVLTSPPYINVFNYHQQYRPAVEALDHDVLEAARSEIGSNRKHRMNRFLTVVQYAIDIAATLDEMKRILRDGGRMIIVIGRESKVRGASIANGSLISSLAVAGTGLRPVMRQERSFRNRFGENIVEDLLHFERSGEFRPTPHGAPVAVAKSVLEALLTTTDGEVRADVLAALALAAEVKPSPMLNP